MQINSHKRLESKRLFRHDENLRVRGQRNFTHGGKPNRFPRPLHGFTIIELLVAITVLTVVFVVVGGIVSQLRRTVGLASAQNDVATNMGAIERTLREDFRRITRDGFMVIRNAEVNGVRSDQILFFATGPWTSVRFAADIEQTYQANVARIIIGHSASDNAGADPLPGEQMKWMLGRHQLLITPSTVTGANATDIWDNTAPDSICEGVWDIVDQTDMLTIRSAVLNEPTLADQVQRMNNACFRIYGQSFIDRDNPPLAEQFYVNETVLASNCSQVKIEFAGDYDDDVNNEIDRDAGEIRWYGLGNGNVDPTLVTNYPNVNIGDGTGTAYSAVFGYDQSATPWPKLVRITIDLYDRGNPPRLYEEYQNDATHTASEIELQGARRFSFVFRVPE